MVWYERGARVCGWYMWWVLFVEVWCVYCVNLCVVCEQYGMCGMQVCVGGVGCGVMRVMGIVCGSCGVFRVYECVCSG